MNRLEYLQAVKKLLASSPLCAEIGVYRGDFSKMILDVLEPKHLWLIDPFETGVGIYEDGLPTAYSATEDLKITCKKIAERRNVSYKRDYSYNVVKKTLDASLDFIYHDASHLYEDLKRDLIEWLPKKTNNGYIGGHDYGNEVFTGVKKAVDEFCEERNLKIVLLSDEGDFALK